MGQVTLAVASTLGGIAPLVDSFVRHLRAENKSPKTIVTYREACDQLVAFLVSNGMPTVAASIRREHVESFIDSLLQRFSASTARNRFRSLQQFFKWLTDEGEIPKNPMGNMRPPKAVDPLTPVLPDDALRAMLKACEGTSFEARPDGNRVGLQRPRAPD